MKNIETKDVLFLVFVGIILMLIIISSIHEAEESLILEDRCDQYKANTMQELPAECIKVFMPFEDRGF